MGEPRQAEQAGSPGGWEMNRVGRPRALQLPQVLPPLLLILISSFSGVFVPSSSPP